VVKPNQIWTGDLCLDSPSWSGNPTKANRNFCTAEFLTTIAERSAFFLWVTGGEYSDPGMDYYEQKYHQQILTHLKDRAAALGLELIPIEQPPDENTPSVPSPTT
jgi:hypothetical protein